MNVLDRTFWLPTFFFFTALLLSLSAPNATLAQDNSSNQGQEVYLAFSHRNVVNNVVTAYYKDDNFYLPVIELFELLRIDVQTKMNGYVKVYGNYLDSGKAYEIDFSSGYIRLGEKRIELHASDYLLKDVDFFLHPSVLKEVFALSFDIDFNSLSLQMDSPHTMPAVAKFQRQQDRRKNDYLTAAREHYQLKYGRDRHILNGGFLDYTLSTNISSSGNLHTYSSEVGTEILGGDFQGSLFGSYSEDYSSFSTDNLRWRYVSDDNRWLRQTYIGQVQAMGLTNNQLRGLRISNEPVRNRTIFDEFIIDGHTTPESEVELYINNQLIGYKTADEMGYYRFSVPLSYGNSRVNLKIFGPNGQVTEQAKRVQIPFTYLPPGEVQYSASAGQMDTPFLNRGKGVMAAQTKVSAGLAKWLTASAGAEYMEGYHDQTPTIYGSLSARLFSQYLVNVQAAPEAYYTFSANAVYPSSLSWGLNATHYTASQGIYNLSGLEKEISANIFIPLKLGSVPLTFRMLGSRQYRSSSSLSRYQFDFGARVGGVSLRAGYRDTQLGHLALRATEMARATGVITYSLPRGQNIPFFIRGGYLRAQTTYHPSRRMIEDIDLSYSQNLSRDVRMQMNFSHNLLAGYNTFGLNLTIDFNHFRNNSSARSAQNSYAFTNSMRGSIGFDSNNGNVLFNNRQQVGRSGAAVRMFVDKNSNGRYEKAEDELLPQNAVRLQRSAATRLHKRSGTTYITQLQPYERYDLEINKGAISNPLLVPALDRFSFVSDPNAYKAIDIPFYISGIIEGKVERMVRDTVTAPVAGLRLYLENEQGKVIKELRTFSDGSFYAYEVPPGNYTLRPDSAHLDILNMKTATASRQVKVDALAEGDFISGLEFALVPRDQSVMDRNTMAKASPYDGIFEDPNTLYKIQLGSYKELENAQRAARQAQQLFGQEFQIEFNPERALHAIRSRGSHDRRSIVNELLQIHHSPFHNAILVAIPWQNETGDQPNRFITEHFVQLGAFKSQENALQMARYFNDAHRLSARIIYDSFSGFYKVQSEGIAEAGQANRVLADIRSKASYEDAFMRTVQTESAMPLNTLAAGADFAYQVHLEGVTPQSENAYLSAITDGLASTDLNIGKGPEEELLIFNNLKEWKTVVQLKQTLSRISTTGKPFIVLIETPNKGDS